MAWYSILPSHLTTYETWIIRAFLTWSRATTKLVLAVINIAPWILAILYDLLLYVGRVVWHEIPIWGGRARGERRPRAPSLRDRTRRRISIAGIVGSTSGAGPASPTSPARKSKEEHDTGTEKRRSRHRKSLSGEVVKEENEEDLGHDE